MADWVKALTAVQALIAVLLQLFVLKPVRVTQLPGNGRLVKFLNVLSILLVALYYLGLITIILIYIGFHIFYV